jgi:hypothetical protein
VDHNDPLKNDEKWGFLNISMILMVELSKYIIPLKTTKNGVLSVHDPHGGSWTHNPLKNDEKWGPKYP